MGVRHARQNHYKGMQYSILDETVLVMQLTSKIVKSIVIIIVVSLVSGEKISDRG